MPAKAHPTTQAAARYQVRAALKAGKMSKPQRCEVCDTGASGLIAHHYAGYAKPLSVWWICESCNRHLAGKHAGQLTLAAARTFVADKKESGNRLTQANVERVMADFAARDGEISVPLTLTREQLYNLAPLIPILDRFLEAAANADKWRQLKPAFKDAAPAIGDAFIEQAEALAKEGLTQASWLEAWDGIADETVKTLLGPVQNAAAAGLEAGAAAIAKQFTVSTGFNLKNPRAVKYLKQHGATLVKDINDTTRDRIQTIVAEGAEQGLSYTEVGNLIAAEFESFAPPPRGIVDILFDKAVKRSRAEIVAITELGQGYEAGNAIVIDDLVAGGLKMEKKWLTVGDDKVDDKICGPNQAQGWIPVEDAFQSGHMTPLGHVICRCTALYRRKPRK